MSEATRTILLESAYFHPLVIRKATRLLGFSSDSAYRFERSVNIGGILDSSDLACSLILKYAAGKPGKLFKAGSDAQPLAKALFLIFPGPINYWEKIYPRLR